jgi:hypothetical protein
VGQVKAMEKADIRRFMIWAGITTFCRFAIWLLSPCIFIWTLYLAHVTSSPWWLAILPFIAQVCWIWLLWGTTGTFLNSFTLACFAWIALAVIGIFARMKADTAGHE